MDEAKPFKSPVGAGHFPVIEPGRVRIARCATGCAAAKDIAKNNCFKMSVIALPGLDPGIDRAIQ